MAQKQTVLAEDQAEMYSWRWFFVVVVVGKNVKLSLISHLQGEGECKMTRRDGKGAYGHLFLLPRVL